MQEKLECNQKYIKMIYSDEQSNTDFNCAHS